jgi:hypothetical protein
MQGIGEETKMKRRSRNQRGTALVAVTVLSVALAGLCAALLCTTTTNEKVLVQTRSQQRAFYAAEAGLSDAFLQVSTGALVPEDGAVLALGTADEPLSLGSCSYWVEISEADGDPRGYTLVATGFDGNRRTRLREIVSKEATGFFQFAAFGYRGVALNSNAFVDSYDSAFGPYTLQVHGGNEFARENGDIGSNGDVVLRSNTEIHGDARPGPGHVVVDDAPGILVTGSTDPLSEPVAQPPIDVPSIPSTGAINGTSNVTLGPGDVHVTSVLMQGGTTLTIRGPARIVVDDLKMRSNSGLTFDSTNGQIELYSLGDFNLQSNSTVTTLSDSALDVTLFLNGDNMSPGSHDIIQLGANSEFIGAIYAPHAQFSLASNFDIYGSIYAGYLDLSSFGQIHFDEALLYDGPGASGELVTRLWRPMPNS